MSDGAAFASGLLIGLIIVLPIFVANRHKLAHNLRLLLDSSTAADGDPTDGEEKPSEGLSWKVIAFGCSCGAISIIVGAILGEPIVLVTGVVLLTSTFLTAIVSRRLYPGPSSERDST
jgi:hypothetical protein